MVSEVRPLDGVKVCMLRASNYANDARARKQATTLTQAGAHVVMVGIGKDVARDLIDFGHDARLLAPEQAGLNLPRLGREDVWWPLRVAVNLTYTRLLQWRFMSRRSSFVYPYETELFESAKALAPDIVHAYNIHTLPAAVRIKRETGARVIYDCRDLFGDDVTVEEVARQRYRDVEAKLIGSADAVITVCEPLADVLESRYGIRRPVVVFNGPSEVMSSAVPAHKPLRLLFQGVFRDDRNLDYLIEAMRSFTGRATLTLQGFGGVERQLRNLVIALGLSDRVSFIPPVDPHDVVVSASDYDVGIICSQADSLNMRSSVPNKLMDYLGAGLALAVSDLPGHRSVLEGTGAAVFIDPTSAETVATGIEQLLDDPERVTAMKRAALETGRLHEWSVQALKLIQVYELALGGERGTDV